MARLSRILIVLASLICVVVSYLMGLRLATLIENASAVALEHTFKCAFFVAITLLIAISVNALIDDCIRR